jgi:hypothetical protein
MNTRKRSALVIASVLCGAAVAAGPATEAIAAPTPTAASATSANSTSIQTSWTKVWQASVSRDYLQSHGNKWISQGYRQPNGSRMGRGVFTCGGNGSITLTVWNLDTGKKKSETNSCNGERHHTPVVGYQNGETLKLIVKGSKTSSMEAWAGR